MFENQVKGSYGSYSHAGRNSAAKYHIIINKDKILDSQNNDHSYKYPFGSDNNNEKLVYNQTKLDIFDLNQVPNNSSNNNKKRKANSIPKKSNNIQQIFNKSLAKAKNASVLFYSPKLDYIKKRTLTGPKWDSLCGRNPIHKVSYNTSEFYITKDMFASLGKSYVNMKKQTQRGEFGAYNDVRIRSERPFSQPKEIRAYHEKNNSIHDIEELSSQDKEMIITFYPHNKTLSTSNDQLTTKRQTISDVKVKRIKYQKTTLTQHTVDASRQVIIPSLKFIKAPNFNKTTSRDYHYHQMRDKTPIAPFLIPNYSAITERPKSIVPMDRSIKTNKRNRSIRDKDPEPYVNYDIINKAYDKINNHHVHASPNFGIMTSRPDGHDYLPSYMQKTHNRNSFYITTEKTLAMNHYSNGKLISNPDTFKPKKSFNKFVNFNQLLVDQTQMNSAKSNLIEAPFTNMMNFYKKNFDEENRKGSSRFDGVTFKTVKKKYALDDYEKDKFTINVYDKK